MYAGIANGFGSLSGNRSMTNQNMAEHQEKAVDLRRSVGVNWNRLEGVLAVGALLTSFIWFLGMPTGMAIGVGFGIVLLLDFARSLIFDSASSDRSRLTTTEIGQQ